jgi:hypothetical protein
MHGTLPQSHLPNTPGIGIAACSSQSSTSFVQYHRERAVEETNLAEHASSLGPAAIHTPLADMHMQLVGKALSDSFSPSRRSPAWRAFALRLISRYFLVKSLRTAFRPLVNCSKAQHVLKDWRWYSGI